MTRPTPCPVHPDVELRRENNHWTGYCGKCARHYDMCTSVRYMEICGLLKGHGGKHEGIMGGTWEYGDEWLYQ